MLECLIVGDQYAMDIATLNDKCYVAYTANINSEEFSNRFKKFPKANKTVISLGSFDSYITIKSLAEYRARFGRGVNIIWVLPSKSNQNREYISTLASQYDDFVTERPTAKEVEVAKANFYKRENIQPKVAPINTTFNSESNLENPEFNNLNIFWPPFENNYSDEFSSNSENQEQSLTIWPAIKVSTK